MLLVQLPLLPGGLMMAMWSGMADQPAEDADTDAADPDTDIDTPDGSDMDGVAPDTLTITENFATRGVFTVPDAVTRIAVNVNAGGTVIDQTGFGDYALQTAEGEEALVIAGTAAAETFVLNGSGYILTTGDGADRVEIEGAQDFILNADEGDTVIGPDAADRVGDTTATLDVVLLGTGATYQGGDVGMDVTATGDTATMIGGAGDDVFTTFAASTMSGGDGDDILVAAGGAANNNPSQTDRLADYLSVRPNLLDGGAGDDTIFGSYADTITAGGGADDLTLYLDPDMSGTTAPQITDFDKASDHLLIWYDSVLAADPLLPPLVSEIAATETGGDTVITGRGGAVVAVLKGETGLRIGVTEDLGDGPRSYTDLAGNPVVLADLDVVIQRYLDIET